MPNILIVDDHPVIRLAVRQQLEHCGYQVVAEAGSGTEAIQQARAHAVDLVILDISLPKLDGLEVIGRLRAQGGGAKVIVFTAQSGQHVVARCMRAGAMGFVSKDNELDTLGNAARMVLAGYSFFPYVEGATLESVTAGEEHALIERLTDREMTVLRQLALGKSNKQIAEAMLISNKTVSTYKTRVMQKLSADSLVELVEFAKRHHIV
ncbi:response regulator [Zobellella sp. DQSA1]|uniref:response regulator n=1 Tax=Zobellella sp. DQSA1 TaxID=3342386 RepID=UPI0035C09640